MNLINIWYCLFIFVISGLSLPGSDSGDALKKAADRDFIWLEIATAVVAIGILFEVGEVCRELKRWRKARGRKRSWVPVMSAAGLLFVTIGVVGEGIFEGKLGITDTRIREIDEKTAQDAGDAAGRAEQSAQGAAADAVLAKSSANLAKKAADKAQGKADAVGEEAHKLDRELRVAKTQLDAVDAKRAELETSLINLAVCNAPRVIPFWSISGKENSTDPLRPFAGQAIIEFVPDAETRRAAFNIFGALDKAGWKVSRPAPVDGIDDGVEIQPSMAPPGDSRAAANAVVDFLHSYNWQARRGWPLDEKHPLIRDPKIIPPDSLRIRVGLYPPVTYVSPPGAKDFAAAVAENKQKMEKYRKQIEAEELKKDEEILKHLTKQQAIEFKARREQRKKEIEL
jgi:hypothetical protein